MEPAYVRVCNQAPEICQTPSMFVKKTAKERLFVDGCRRDGRDVDEIRPVYLEMGIVNECTGSAYLEMGDTKIVCSVFGPRELPRSEDFSMEGQIVCEFKFAPFSSRSKPSQDSVKYISSLLTQALQPAVKCDSFPNLQLLVCIMVLEDGGGVLAASVACAGVALATGRVEMNDLPSPCSLLLLSDDRCLVDPTTSEEYHLADESEEGVEVVCGLTVVHLPSLDELAFVQQLGVADLKQSLKTMELCIEGCRRMHERLKKFLMGEK